MARQRRQQGITTQDRRARYRKGHIAEFVAAAILILKGYRVLVRRYRTRVGEVDLIAVRRKRLAFVEVKHRPTIAQAEQALTASQRERVIRAAENWLGHNPSYRHHEFGLDLMLLAPWRLPRHMPNAFYRPWHRNAKTGY